MRKIVIISELAAGGVERVNYLLAKGFSKNHIVKVISVKGIGKELIHDIDYIVLGKSSGKKGIFDLLKAVRKEKPDWIITCDHTATMCALLYRTWFDEATKCMVVIHSVYSSMFQYNKKYQLLFRHYIPKILEIYNRCDAVIYVSKGVKEDFKRLYRINNSHEYVIYNPVFLEMPYCQRYLKSFSSPLRIVTAGRLEVEKRHAFLIEAVHRLKDLQINTELYIYGEGSLEFELRNQARIQGVDAQVFFCGFHKNLIEELSQYDLFCLASEFESFGNVLVEAMGARVPVIAIDCPYGPREILEYGKYGYLLDSSIDAIVRQIAELAVNGPNNDMIDRAYQRAEEFKLVNVIKRYEKVMMDENRTN